MTKSYPITTIVGTTVYEIQIALPVMLNPVKHFQQFFPAYFFRVFLLYPLQSAYQGKGDRASESEWAKVHPPVDVVLFEGWMLGFTPIPENQAAAVDAQVGVVVRD